MVRRFVTVTAAAASYDLTDLATVKDELEISGTGKDAFLTRAIGQASAAIASYCNRVFPPERLSETFHLLDDDSNFNLDGAIGPLQLSRFPAIVVRSVTENDVALVEGTDYLVDYEKAQLHRLSAQSLQRVVRWACSPIAVAYDAGYGAALTESGTVPATPFKITVTKAAAFAFDESVTRNDGTVFVKVGGAPAAGQYSVAAGVYTFNTANAGDVLAIRYVYTAIPYDLVTATLKAVTARFGSRGRDPFKIAHSEPGIGEDRYWIGNLPNQDGAFTPEIQGLIDPYREPAL